MSIIKPRLALLGGGIRGTTIAALLAQSNSCEVILLERGDIASGATATNHGRLHLGTGQWRSGSDESICRRRAGAELMQRLPGVVEQQMQGIHLLEAVEDIEPFEMRCQRCAIPYKRVDSSSLHNLWVRDDQFAAIYEVPEYAFNPARVAGKLAAYAKSLGADIRTQSFVTAIEAGADRAFSIWLDNGSSIAADIIVNALGCWLNTPRSALSLPRPNLQWHQWKVLCLYMPTSANEAPLQRAVTIIDRANRIPSALPHHPWIAFGCDQTPEILASLDDEDTQKWREFNSSHIMDSILFDANVQHFLPLQTLSSREISRWLFTFSGIYPRLEGRKGSPFRIHQSSAVPHYYAVTGGVATTALLDAMDVTQVLFQQDELLNRASSNYVQIMEYVVQGFGGEAPSRMDGMIWEQFTEEVRQQEKICASTIKHV